MFELVANAFAIARLFLKPRPTIFPCPFLLLVRVSIACPTTRPTTFPSPLASTSPHPAPAFKLASVLKHVPVFVPALKHVPEFGAHHAPDHVSEFVPNHAPDHVRAIFRASSQISLSVLYRKMGYLPLHSHELQFFHKRIISEL